MIELTRLNRKKLYVNSDMIKYAEASPDTTLTLATGEKIVVLEPCQEVMARVFEVRVKVLEAAWPGVAFALGAMVPHSHTTNFTDASHRYAQPLIEVE